MDFSSLATELLHYLHDAHKSQHHRNIRETLQGEAFALHFIESHCNSTISAGDIGRNIGVSSARVATLLNEMEEKGLVTREIDREDRRRIIVKITAKGREIAEKNKRDFLQRTVELLTSLGEYDAREFVRIMGRLAQEITNTY